MKVLLIDNDKDILDSLYTALEPAGYRCYGFSSPEEALEAYRRRRCDVVVTDLMMPGLSGIDILRKILSSDPKTRVIDISASRIRKRPVPLCLRLS
ncbi:MAG: response regulator [Bacillota bacterium]